MSGAQTSKGATPEALESESKRSALRKLRGKVRFDLDLETTRK